MTASRLDELLDERYGDGAAARARARWAQEDRPSRKRLVPRCSQEGCIGAAALEVSTERHPHPLLTCLWHLGLTLARVGVVTSGTVTVHRVLDAAD